jgi:hypothetical protein
MPSLDRIPTSSQAGVLTCLGAAAAAACAFIWACSRKVCEFPSGISDCLTDKYSEGESYTGASLGAARQYAPCLIVVSWAVSIRHSAQVLGLVCLLHCSSYGTYSRTIPIGEHEASLDYGR